ncbi:MAG: potassium/proton antiporter, partial [Phycicoccus sp.]
MSISAPSTLTEGVAQIERVAQIEDMTRDGFTVDDLATVLLIGSLVLVVAVVAVRLSLRSGLPSLLLYLGIGVALGESGLGIRYDDEQLTQVLGYAALVVILVEG